LKHERKTTKDAECPECTQWRLAYAARKLQVQSLKASIVKLREELRIERETQRNRAQRGL